MAWHRPRPLLALVCLGALSFCVDARGRGRGRGRNRGHGGRRSRFGGGDYGGEEPMPDIPVKFVHAEELDAEEYELKVKNESNSTVGAGLPITTEKYFSFVLFHVSWCQHCRQTLPEFEKAAELINKSTEEGKLKGLEKPVKFFLIQCDATPENMKQCQKHCGTAFPVLKLFRDRRAIQFTGPRWGKTMGEWSAHVSRPVVLKVQTKQEMNLYTEHSSLFMMKANVAKQDNLHGWFELAYRFIEEFYFCVVPMDSELQKYFPAKQSVTVRGKGVEALPFKGKLDWPNLRQWVEINRWPIVVEMTPEVSIKLLQSGRRVVAYAYKYKRGVKLDSQEEGQVFRERATELRRKHDLVFASMDCAARDNSEFLGSLFSVVSVPSLFVFTGNVSLKSEVVYWEDPGLTAQDLSIESIEELVNSSWARQDNSTEAWVKGWTKRVTRFGLGSFIGFIVVILLPLAFTGLCCLCIKELWSSDEQMSEVAQQNRELLRTATARTRVSSQRSSTSKRIGKRLTRTFFRDPPREIPADMRARLDPPNTQDTRSEPVTSIEHMAPDTRSQENRVIEDIDEDDSDELLDDVGPQRQVSGEAEPPQELMDESTPKDEKVTKRRVI